MLLLYHASLLDCVERDKKAGERNKKKYRVAVYTFAGVRFLFDQL